MTETRICDGMSLIAVIGIELSVYIFSIELQTADLDRLSALVNGGKENV